MEPLMEFRTRGPEWAYITFDEGVTQAQWDAVYAQTNALWREKGGECVGKLLPDGRIITYSRRGKAGNAGPF